MLLEALVACAGTTLSAVATAMGIKLRGGRIVAEGLGMCAGRSASTAPTPVGLTDVALVFEIDADADADKLARLIETTERYCVILQTLKAPPTVTVAPDGRTA